MSITFGKNGTVKKEEDCLKCELHLRQSLLGSGDHADANNVLDALDVLDCSA